MNLFAVLIVVDTSSAEETVPFASRAPGTGRLSQQSKHDIEPLQMTRFDQGRMKYESSDGKEDDELALISIREIALDFQENVPRLSRRRINPNAFLGKEAVTFLLNKSYASSRQEAVELGLRMQHELGLFRHVRRRQIDFKDTDTIFVFSDVESPAFVFATHKPRFAFISRLLFSYKEGPGPDVHMEFPYASASDPSRFSVRDCIHSGESMNMLVNMKDANSDEDGDDEEESFSYSQSGASRSGSKPKPSSKDIFIK